MAAKEKKATKKSSKINTAEIKEFDLIADKIIEPGADNPDLDESASDPKIKKVTHFDIIKYIFTDIDSFNQLTDYTLKQNFFMLNRTFSIKYPQQAAAFNHMNINMAEAVRIWAKFLRAKEGTGRVPSFVYTKGAKRSAEESQAQEEGLVISKQLMEEYCKFYKLSLRDYKDMLELRRQQTIDDVIAFEKKHSEKSYSFKSSSKED